MRDRRQLQLTYMVIVVLIFVFFSSCSNKISQELSTIQTIPEQSWVAAWSSTITLSPDENRLYVVNSDSGSVTAVDTDSETVMWEVPVGVGPSTLAVSPGSDRLYVAVRNDGLLVALDAYTGEHIGTTVTGPEPYGVITSVDGKTVIVSESASDSVSFFDAARLELLKHLDVRSRPRGLAVSSDGRSLYITHFLKGDLTVVDLVSRVVRTVTETGSENNASQHVAIDPAGGRAYMPHIRSRVNNPNLAFDTTLQPLVTVVDLKTDQIITRELLGLDAVDRPVGMPSAVAFSPDGTTLYVVNASSNDISVVDLSMGFGIGHIEVGDNPKGIVVTTNGKTAYVHNVLSGDLSVVDLDNFVENDRIQVTTNPLPPDVLAGKILFHSSDRIELAKDQWISCASCHFESGHDGRTWILSEGLRNTTSIKGLSATAPFHWSGDRSDLFDFNSTVVERQFGTGLSEEENAQLAAFLGFEEFSSSPFLKTEATERGRLIFETIGCTNCHVGKTFTDGLLHEVGTGNRLDERFDLEFNTPTLLGLWDSAPYLHHGQADTLYEVFSGKHGQEHALNFKISDSDLNDVVAYLLSLPSSD